MPATARLALALIAAAAGQDTMAQTASGLSPRDVAALLDELAACTGGAEPFALAVAGLAADQTALSEDEAAALRLDVEGALGATGRVRLAAARDVDRLRSLREGTTGLAAAEAEALIARAHEGDAVVFVVSPERRDASVGFRLQAISPDGACKVTSLGLEASLAADGAASPDRVIAGALDALDAAAPDLSDLTICPIVANGGHSACAGALTDRLVALAVASASSPDRLLSEHPLAVSRSTPAECSAPGEGTRMIGRLGIEGGSGWLDLEVTSGARVLSALPRTRVDLGLLGCDPVLRPFLDHVAATARTDRAVLDMTAPPFASGTRLEVSLELGEARPLYCWVLAPDGTAFVALPADEDPVVGPGRLAYPTGFGLADVVLDGEWENLFHCFVPATALPPDLDARWRSFGPAGDATLLEPGTVADLLDATRALPDVTEAVARIVVR